MSNVQTAAVVDVQNAADTNQSLTPITKLLRFLYTGTSSNAIPVNTKPDLNNIEELLSFVNDMATARALLPISTIRKVYQAKQYPRVDECLIALAYCAKQTHSEELRMLANNEAITLITDQSNFLHFVHYCAKISQKLRGSGHTNFGHGMCRMIEKWYEKYSPVDLANIFGEHRGLHGWTHSTVISKAHVRTKKRPPAAAAPPTHGASGTTNTNGDINANGNIASSSNENSTSTASTSASASTSTASTSTASTSTASNAQSVLPTLATTEDEDREHVFQFIFSSGTQSYLKYLFR